MNDETFVDWFRRCTPYIYRHRGRTFVLAFGGEALADGSLPNLVHDIALLHGLGIRLVLVHGARPQIEERLARLGVEMRYVGGLRVTDDAALGCVKEAAGVARVEIEALLSLGLANTPMAGVRIPVASGNFVTAQPLGVIDGTDYLHTGEVRRIDRQALRKRLDEGAVALLPPIGYSPTGEVFNLSAADVARAAATALAADKLIFLLDGGAVHGPGGSLIPSLLASEVDALLQERHDLPEGDDDALPEDLDHALRAAAEACRGGIRRIHLVDRLDGGALLRELFTQEGAGTLISAEPFEETRPARFEDVVGIRAILRPLEQQAVLVRRSRERIETELGHYLVTERDGTIIACAALFCYAGEHMAELASVAVHPDYRGGGRGDRLLSAAERLARDRGVERLFVLTTRTAHWFRERGFEPGGIDDLPPGKRDAYNQQRNSRVYIKTL